MSPHPGFEALLDLNSAEEPTERHSITTHCNSNDDALNVMTTKAHKEEEEEEEGTMPMLQ